MDKTVITTLSLDDLQTVIIDCVNSCLRNNRQLSQAAESDRWLNLRELCDYHPDKPTKATVYGWVSNGLIPVHKSQKRLRFLKSEIDAWLLKGKRLTLDESASIAEKHISSNKKGGKG